MPKKKKEIKDIYKMELHEVMSINSYNSMMRVPHGWIYTEFFGESGISKVFVPYDREFKK